MNTAVQKASPSLEAIDFQKDAFFKALVNIISGYREAYNKPGEKSSVTAAYSKKLVKVLRDFTDSEAMEAFFTNDPRLAWIGPFSISPDVNKNSIVLDIEQKTNLNSKMGYDYLEKNPLIKGGVDLRTGKFTGDFKKFPSMVIIPTETAVNAFFTPEEIAGVTIHEVGHISVFFELISRTVTNNQVLAYVARTYGDKTYTDREKILVSVKKTLNLKDLDTAELAKEADPDKVNMVILNDNVVETRSELGSDIYDAVSWEQLADEYAARQGAGLPLLSYLSKIGSRKTQQRTSSQYWMFEAFKIGLAATTGLLAAAGTAGLAVSVIPMIMLYASVEADKAGPKYDAPKDRMIRVRNQMVQAIKDQSIPKARVKQITQDIHLADEVLNEMAGKDQLWTILKEYINPYTRKNRQLKHLQKELEGLAHNDFFILSAELKHNLK